MKLEIGKLYRMANGDVATLMELHEGKAFPWRGMFGTPFNGGSMSWNDNGDQCNFAPEYKLVEECTRIAPLTTAEIDEMHSLPNGSFDIGAAHNIKIGDPVSAFERAIDPPIVIDLSPGAVNYVGKPPPPVISHAQQAAELRAALRLLLREADHYAEEDSPLADTVLVAESILERYTP